MRVTYLILAAPLLLSAVSGAMAADAPASFTGDASAKAAPKSAEQSAAEMMAMADKLSDPKSMDQISKMTSGFAAAMMQMPIGQMAAAIDKAAPGALGQKIASNATVADVIGNDAKDLPSEFGAKSKEMMGMMGGLTKAFAAMMPEFEKLGREIAAKMPKDFGKK